MSLSHLFISKIMKKTNKNIGIIVGILLGILLTSLFSFLLSFIVSYISNDTHGGGEIITFSRGWGAFFGGGIWRDLGKYWRGCFGRNRGGRKTRQSEIRRHRGNNQCVRSDHACRRSRQRWAKCSDEFVPVLLWAVDSWRDCGISSFRNS